MGRVLLVTQYFYPENFKSNDIAFELVKRGYKVMVLTGIPNYPKGAFFEGYGLFRKRIQRINGVKVIRASLFPRGNGGKKKLALNYFSWSLFASIFAFFMSIFCKFECIIVHQTSPVIQGLPAVIVKKIQRIPIYFWVLDLWPESLSAAGNINNKKILSFFTKTTKFLYNNSDKILISSRSFKKSIIEMGNYNDKIIYFPNWAEDVFYSKDEFDNELPQLSLLPEDFTVMFAGNIGEAQDFENVMRCALMLKEYKTIKFIIIGDGRKKAWLDKFILDNSLSETVFCLGRFPLHTMPSFFKKADVMLLSLKNEIIFNLTVPAKLQAYMAMGKPVIAMINGEGNDIINESNCGIAVNAGDFELLANSLLKLKRLPYDELKKMGDNGNLYCKKYFDKKENIDKLCSIMKNMIYDSLLSDKKVRG